MTTNDEVWVPDSCTLPTAERPLRVAEFDELFAAALRSQQRLGPTRLRWLLDPAAEASVRDLTARENSCCSFFTFTISAARDGLQVDVQVPDRYAQVVDGLTARAARAATA